MDIKSKIDKIYWLFYMLPTVLLPAATSDISIKKQCLFQSICTHKNSTSSKLLIKYCYTAILDERFYRNVKTNVIYLDMNKVRCLKIEQSFFRNLKLRKLSLMDVDVESMLSVDLFRSLKYLKILDIRNSTPFVIGLKKLGFIPDSVCKHLEQFRVSSPSFVISIPEHTFKSCRSLRNLTLDGKLLSSDFMAYLPQVTNLHLSSSMLSELNLSSFEGLANSLQFVTLRNVGIQTLDGSSFDGLKNLRKLNILVAPNVTITKSFLLFLERNRRKVFIYVNENMMVSKLLKKALSSNNFNTILMMKSVKKQQNSESKLSVASDIFELDENNPDVLIDWENDLIGSYPTQPSIVNFTADWLDDERFLDIRCLASGDPPIAIFIDFPDGWQKYFCPAHRGLHYLVVYPHIIRNIKDYDGDYTCNAVNGYGQESNILSINLHALAIPTLSNYGTVYIFIHVLVVVLLVNL